MPPGLAAGIITAKTVVVSVPSGGLVCEEESAAVVEAVSR